MPVGARRSLVGAVLLGLALGPAQGQPAPGGAWTDPPARAPVANPAPATPPGRTETPARQVEAPPAPEPIVRTEASAPGRGLRQRTAVRPQRRIVARVAVLPRPRRVAAVPHRAAASRVARYERYAAPYPVGRVAAPEDGYGDERLGRLRAATEAGYIVMRRRSVEFPDGRSLRIYRPVEDGYDPF
ncbi:hypothetical protein [Methylobacterium trifolii]|uniref:Uncharacterized protein n=1 Tax=Methylobacterium trifolii TaxID=1003092 RepID=A0ABQ4U0M1_9HYPH|nr:hypothetical protein [Methylobacterium trifolii]GJE61033.1 hypothetical protein MPOCJGCO_3154 [Methylobacterium trifolii]